MSMDTIARRDYRINIRGNDTVRLRINKALYEIIDISSGGIGIRLTSGEPQVTAGEEVACELQINGLARTFRGKVVHVTPQRPGYSLAGLQFIEIADEIKDKLLHFLQVCRKEKFRER